MSVVVIIPARFGSTRFPGKPLVEIAGRTLIEWVWRRAGEISGVDHTLVATDDDRIADAVRAFGGTVVVTESFKTGTDRVAAVAAGLDADIVVNLQGDEPVFDPTSVGDMITLLEEENNFDMSTAAHRIASVADFESREVVKVVFDSEGCALYFSRAPIPSGAFGERGGDAYRHVGIYAYRNSALQRFAALERTPAEISESLEQLRALENGMKIGVVVTQSASLGVDVPDDLKNVEKAIARIYTD